MEPILVYGFPSGSSMGLLAVREWLGRPYRACRVDMLGEMREPAYLHLNRRCETPVLITHDGRVLTETLAIAAWIEARDTGRRVSFGTPSAEADRMRQLMAFINTGFTGAFSPLWAALEGDMPESDKAVLRAFGAASVRERHDRLEELLERETVYAVADRPTIADGVFVGVARWLDVHGLAEPGRWPRIEALRARLEADPAVRFALALEAGVPATGSGALLEHLPMAEVIGRYGG